MMHTLRRIFLIVLFLGSAALWAQSNLSMEQTRLVAQAVFEVVIEKPAEGTVEYEEELPLELLPWQYRHDAYESIGTAFAVGENLFLSAAHVFTPEYETIRENISLRDASGKVYPVTQVLKYDNYRDFILFSVEGMSGNSRLNISSRVSLNDYVYAVGNAYGEGIIIRNGLLTSMTPERENGAWRWLRYSAAASPGNSGGPLLDGAGEVVGIVTAKSENENLNYALPISEVGDFEAGEGSLHVNMVYQIPNINYKYREIFDYPISLPRDFSDLKKELTAYQRDIVGKSITGLVDGRSEEIFPGDTGSRGIFTTTFATQFPGIINEKDDSTWQISKPDEMSTSDLKNGGYFQSGKIWGDTFWQLELPKGESVSSLFSSPGELMSYFLTGHKVTRNIGSAEVRITSYGTPDKEEWYEDRWGRKWFVTVWSLPFADCKSILFSLPTPSGAVGIHNIVRTSDAYAYEMDFRVMSDFIYASYSGSFDQWKTFLSSPALVPDSLKSFQFSYTQGESASIHSESFDMQYDGSLIGISDQSRLYMVTGFYKSFDTVVNEMSRLFFYENSTGNNYFALEKKFHPHDEYDSESMEDWTNAVEGKYPFNRDPIFSKGNTLVYETRHISDSDTSLNFVWTSKLSREGDLKDRDMLSLFMKLTSGFSLTDFEKERSVAGTGIEFEKTNLTLIEGLNIFQAVSLDRTDILDRFISTGTDLSAGNEEGRTPLMVAMGMEKTELAEKLIAGGSDLNVRDQYGHTPLLMALRYMPESVSLTLLDRGADPGTADKDGYTPLMEAARRKYDKAGFKIMNMGVPLDSINTYDRSALYYAVYYGLDDLSVELARRGAPVNFETEIKYSLLMAAIEKCSAETARYLMEKGADDDIVSKSGWTPLLSALRYERHDIARDLIRKTRDLNYRTDSGWTPLIMAARYSTLENVRLLIEKGADPHALTDIGQNALMLSFYNEDHRDVADALMDMNLSTDCVDDSGWTTLMTALRYGSDDQKKRLFSIAENYGGVTDSGWTPLMFAVRYGSSDLVRALVEKGNPVNQTSDEGITAFLLAVRYQDLETVKYLVGSGADIMAADSDNYNAVMKAARGGNSLIAGYLLDLGIPADVVGTTGWTPLMLSLRYCQNDLSQRLILMDVPLGRSETDDGWNDFLLALRYSSAEVCNMMLDRGADILKTNDAGYTPLHFAAKYTKEVVARLIDMGAPLDVQNDDGDTPLHMAASRNVGLSVRLLLEAGARSDIKNNDGDLAVKLVDDGYSAIKALFP